MHTETWMKNSTHHSLLSAGYNLKLHISISDIWFEIVYFYIRYILGSENTEVEKPNSKPLILEGLVWKIKV